jgi:hypothetical protein
MLFVSVAAISFHHEKSSLGNVAQKSVAEDINKKKMLT